MSQQAHTRAGNCANSSGRFVALDGLRGICACMVVFFHFRTTGLIGSLSLIKQSWLFVDYFFVLSGFVISAGYYEKLSSGFSVSKFLILRLGRIYPLHVAAMLIFVIFELVVMGVFLNQPFSGKDNFSTLITNLSLTQIFGINNYLGWNFPSWSIAAEFWTYIIFALIFGTQSNKTSLVIFVIFI